MRAPQDALRRHQARDKSSSNRNDRLRFRIGRPTDDHRSCGWPPPDGAALTRPKACAITARGVLAAALLLAMTQAALAQPQRLTNLSGKEAETYCVKGGSGIGTAFCDGFNGAAACHVGYSSETDKRDCHGGWEARRDTDRGKATRAEAERLRRALIKTPPLAAGANPMLGHWRRVDVGPPTRDPIFGLLTGLMDELCMPSFELRADALVRDGRSFSPMQYRAGDDGMVHAFGEREPVRHVSLGSHGRDRVLLSSCAYERVGAAAAPRSAAPMAKGANARRFEEDAGFRCAGRTLILVKFCAPGGADADCNVCQLGESKNRSADSCGPITRAQLAERISAFEEGRVGFAADGAATFAPAARR